MQMYASTVSLSNWLPRYSTIRGCSPSPIWSTARPRKLWFSVGCASNGTVLSVVYLWSAADPAATNIRLISARKSTQAESRQYQEGL